MSLKQSLTIWRRVVFLGFSLVLFGVSLTATLARAAGTLAPLNPAFLSYQQQRLTRATHTVTGHPLGWVPSPIDFSFLAGRQLFPSRVALPTSYDLRTLGRLTPVKDQSTAGTCWAFATCGSLESCLLPKETWDFSENNLKNLSGFDLDPNNGGGNFEMSSAYLARWSGPLTESEDPYNPNTEISPTGLAPVKHVQQIIYLPARTKPTDNDNIKNAVMQYGAVGISLDYEDSAFNPATNAYYLNSTTPQNNHAVCIVGWDDNYPVSNFNTRPPIPGAFIVRNSWGPDWGDHGYFYVSYFDTGAAMQDVCAVFMDTEPTTNYSNIYQYDPLGLCANIGSGPVVSTTVWGANVFTAQGSELLKAVSLYALEPGMQFQISVYTDPTNGPLNTTGPVITEILVLDNEGYNTIVLGNPVPVKSGQKFSVVVKFTGVKNTYPGPVEMPVKGYSMKAVSSPGQSYVSNDGTAWEDLTTGTITFCIKAFSDTLLPPVAVNDNYQGVTNTPLVIPAPGVLSNDSDPNNNPLTASLVSQPANGMVTLNTDGSFTYTPNAGFHGVDSFTYVANDGFSNSNDATVTITVNAPPVAINDYYVTAQNVPLVVTAGNGVLVNDYDPNGYVFTATLVDKPTHGQVTLNQDGSFTYTPNLNFSGNDTFTYQDSNGYATSAKATVTISVKAPPVANNDYYTTLQNIMLTQKAANGVLANDTSPNGASLSAVLVKATTGVLNLNPDGSFSYAPPPDFLGVDSFTYQDFDGHLYSQIATASITVNATGDEGDVNGDGMVGMDDWMQIGRVAAGLNAVPTGAAFQRADCAPAATKGDGVIDMTDWVQAGRYAIGLDSLTSAGGPFSPVKTTKIAAKTTDGISTRTVQLGTVVVGRNQTVTIPVRLTGQGDENALGFTLNFDTKRLTFVGVKLAGTATGALLNTNLNKLTAGSIGVACMLPPPHHLASGLQTVVELTFTVPNAALVGTTSLTFGDNVIPRALVDTLATALPVSFVNGAITIRR